MKIHILTIFPKMFESILNESIINRAQQKKLIEIKIHDLRKWTTDKHKTIDDKPFGGGPGMILMIEPIYKAVQEIKKEFPNAYTIVMSASGKIHSQKKAQSLSLKKDLIFICPHYEGIDQRVIDHIADEAISIGNYVVTGGELPAMVVIDSLVRLIPGVLGNIKSLKEESYSDPQNKFLEYPQYTRPENFKGWKVPQILLSGDHKKVSLWRKKNRKLITLRV